MLIFLISISLYTISDQTILIHSEIIHSVIMRKWRTRFLHEDIAALDVFLPLTWKRSFGMKLVAGKWIPLNMLVMLMAVPFHLLLLISLGTANGI
jgi:hypothetical protein